MRLVRRERNWAYELLYQTPLPVDETAPSRLVRETVPVIRETGESVEVRNVVSRSQGGRRSR
jgi:hypothetical protein